MNDAIYTAAAISAYHATHALDQARVQSIIRARDVASAAKVLTECGYVDTDSDIETIVETERRRAFEMFMQHCIDSSVGNIVAAFYKFKTTPLGVADTLAAREAELISDVETNVVKVKNHKVRQYFRTYLDAWKSGAKVSNDRLWEIGREMRLDLDGNGPLFYWYIYKHSEFIAVRVLLTGKRFNYEREVILNNLGRFYDRFK
jgi:hypothetical protein